MPILLILGYPSASLKFGVDDLMISTSVSLFDFSFLLLFLFKVVSVKTVSSVSAMQIEEENNLKNQALLEMVSFWGTWIKGFPKTKWNPVLTKSFQAYFHKLLCCRV